MECTKSAKSWTLTALFVFLFSTFDIHRPAGKLKTDIRAYSE